MIIDSKIITARIISCTYRMEKMLMVVLSSVLLASTSCTLLNELKSEKMEFKCYSDRCRVGVQFCLEEDQACRHCNEDVCNEPDSPSMCIPYCKSLYSGDLSSEPSVETTTPCHNNDVMDQYVKISTLVIVSVVAGCIVIALVTVIACVVVCWRRGRFRREMTPRYSSPVQDTQPPGHPPNESFTLTDFKEHI